MGSTVRCMPSSVILPSRGCQARSGWVRPRSASIVGFHRFSQFLPGPTTKASSSLHAVNQHGAPFLTHLFDSAHSVEQHKVEVAVEAWLIDEADINLFGPDCSQYESSEASSAIPAFPAFPGVTFSLITMIRRASKGGSHMGSAYQLSETSRPRRGRLPDKSVTNGGGWCSYQ